SQMSKMSTFEMKKFEGWETALDPDTLSLLSILNFRKTKFDFTYDKRIEHLTISKFVSWIAEIDVWMQGIGRSWVIIPEQPPKQQAQGDGVRMFWNNVELEVDTMKLKQAEVQFAVDQSLTGNKANSILNEMKLSFILNQKNAVIGCKRTYPNEELTQPTPQNKYARPPESKLRSKK
ncbi:9757_t:CDS:2, partial [Funneliformis mosseae]